MNKFKVEAGLQLKQSVVWFPLQVAQLEWQGWQYPVSESG
jgi:hypothetical protein